MRNIVLICSAGMSTSMLVKRMQDQANEQGYEATIGAYSVSEVSKVGKNADIILLGPQVRFQLASVKKQFPDKIVDTIAMQDYGRMDGAKVLNTVKELLGDI